MLRGAIRLPEVQSALLVKKQEGESVDHYAQEVEETLWRHPMQLAGSIEILLAKAQPGKEKSRPCWSSLSSGKTKEEYDRDIKAET